MKTPSRLVVLCLALSLSVLAQRKWAEKDEYDLFLRISSEMDPKQQIALLQEWEVRYPESEFQVERLVTLASAHRKTGHPEESLAAAIQGLSLSPYNGNAQMLVVMVGPTVTDPSEEDIASITAAANRMLAPRPVVTSRVPALPVVPAPASAVQEADSQRVDSLIRDMRRNYRAPAGPDSETARRAAAEAALAWVKSLKR